MSEHDEIKALLTEIRDRLPQPTVTVRLGGQEFPARVCPALDEDGAPPALVGDPAKLSWDTPLPGEPVEPREDEDPDEALAKALSSAWLTDDCFNGSDINFHTLARAAREHIETEGETDE